MYEILDTFKLIPRYKTEFNTYHMCEAPGQFIVATQRYIDKKTDIGLDNYNWYANSLNPDSKINIKKYGKDIFGDDYGLMKYHANRWLFGKDGTGDITKAENLKDIRAHLSKDLSSIDLITGDGGLNTDGTELHTLQLLDLCSVCKCISIK